VIEIELRTPYDQPGDQEYQEDPRSQPRLAAAYDRRQLHAV
jgi:hypothetical protein